MGISVRNVLTVFLCLAALSSWGCASKQKIPPAAPSAKAPVEDQPYGPLQAGIPYEVEDQWYYPLPSGKGYVEDGIASWYGPDFHGKRTSSGERYNQYSMTAAHKTLPMGSVVRVTDLETGRSVKVRINDRGPFKGGRVIDLSYGAARALGTLDKGLVRVRVEALGTRSTSARKAGHIVRQGWLTVQAGAFQDAANAERLRRELEARFNNVIVRTGTERKGHYYRVQVGRFRDARAAQSELMRLRADGYNEAILVRVEE